MKELIKINTTNFNQEIKQTVNARDLHFSLESKQDFSTWIKNRLDGFMENQDFIRFHQKKEANNATMIEYCLTLDTAKHVAMIERNEKGKQIRQYFIDFENNNKQINPFLTTSRKELLRLALEQEEKIEKLETNNIKQEQVINEYISVNNNKTYTAVAKILHLKPHAFIEKLRYWKYINNQNIPYQRYIDCGYFIIKKSINKNNSFLTHFESYLITKKGFEYFFKHIDLLFSDIKIKIK